MEHIQPPLNPDWQSIVDQAIYKVIWRAVLKARPDFGEDLKRRYPAEYKRLTSDL